MAASRGGPACSVAQCGAVQSEGAQPACLLPMPNCCACCSHSPQDVGGCGLKNTMVHALARLPRVFTLQVSWASHSETQPDIAATLAAMDDQVRRGHHGCRKVCVPGEGISLANV